MASAIASGSNSSTLLTDANPFIAQLLGYTRDEMIGRELFDIGLLRDEEASQAAFLEMREKQFIRYEDLPLESKKGQRREVEVVANLYAEDGQSVIQANIRDITERIYDPLYWGMYRFPRATSQPRHKQKRGLVIELM